MGRFPLRLIALVLLPVVAGAVPECKTGTLASYVDLGSDGCSVSGVVVFDFTLLAIPAGSTEIPAEKIAVKPSVEDGRPRLEFSVSARVAARQFVDTQFAFSASGTVGRSELDGMGARMTGASADGDGAVTVVNSVCPRDVFLFDLCFAQQDIWPLTVGTAPTFVTFVAGGEAARSGGIRVAAGAMMGVALDIGVDGGRTGSGALEGVVVLLGSSLSDRMDQDDARPAGGPSIGPAQAFGGRGLGTRSVL